MGIAPALNDLHSGGIQDSALAKRFMLAIALQESGLRHRRQVTSAGTETGPAASFWQFEPGGGCKGVLTHEATKKHMLWFCSEYNVQATPAGLWEAMRYNDVVAAAAARLLIYSLPDKLPTNANDAWDQYLRAWRPGKPHIATWAANWELADRVVKGNV